MSALSFERLDGEQVTVWQWVTPLRDSYSTEVAVRATLNGCEAYATRVYGPYDMLRTLDQATRHARNAALTSLNAKKAGL